MTIPPRGLYAFTGRAVLRADLRVVRRQKEQHWLAMRLWQRARTYMRRV